MDTPRASPVWVKTPREQYEIKGVVYSIPCECERVYIREMGRTLKQRISEHKRVVKNQDKNNGIAVHVLQTGHNGRMRWWYIGNNNGLKGRSKRDSASSFELISQELISCTVDLVRIEFMKLIRWELTLWELISRHRIQELPAPDRALPTHCGGLPRNVCQGNHWLPRSSRST